MAAPEFTSRERREMYRLLTLLNGSLEFVAKRLEELAGNKILSSKYLKETMSLTQKVQQYLDEKIHN